MKNQKKRFLSGVAVAVIIAAIGGVSIARLSSNTTVIAAIETSAGPDEVEPVITDMLAMTPEAIKGAGIVTEAISAGGLNAEIVSQAIVSPSPTGEAIVTARASGAVTQILKRLGDEVEAGESLAVVESRDAAQIAADRTSASAKAVLAQKTLARERYLYDQKVSAKVDLEQAQAESAVATAEAQRAMVAAGAANITPDGRGVMLTSPISGKVTKMNASLGAFVQPETELFRVADPAQIQIDAAVGAAGAARIIAGDKAIVELPNGETVEASVRAVTPTLSGETRSATAVLDVSSGLLQPGLAVRVRIIPSGDPVSNAIVVPEDAVQSLEGRDVVFIRTSDGFKATPVTTGSRSAGRIEIASGLTDGSTIATRNAFLLKAELGKGAGEEE